MSEFLEVKIESLSVGNGSGVAKYQGQVIFVPLGVPGEVCQVQLVKVKKKYSIAKKIKTITPSDFEVKPKCEVFGLCGGCQWQNVKYENQVLEKDKYLSRLFERITLDDKFKYAGVKASVNSYNYRSRIQVHAKGHKVGYYKKASKDIIDIKECPVAYDEISKALKEIKHEGRFDLRADENKDVTITHIKHSSELEFTQVNEDQNKYLMELILKVTESLQSQNIYDLYCGAGNFSLKLAQKFIDRKIIGVESHLAAFKKAKANEGKSNNLKIINSKAEDYLKKNMKGLVILDPPRAGVDEALIKALSDSEVKDIVYISCHPMTWARDINNLQALGSFKLKYLEGVDMFPQTAHLEVFSWLSCQ